MTTHDPSANGRAHIAVPPAAMVRNRLIELSDTQLRTMAADSGVPYGTLVKIKSGVTKNPGIETVRQFFPLLPAK